MAKNIFTIKSTGELGVDEGWDICLPTTHPERKRRINILNENYELTGLIKLVSQSDLEIYNQG